MPVLDGIRVPEQRAPRLARDRLEDELVASSSSRKIDERCALKIARATSTIDREQRAVALLRAEHPGRDRRLESVLAHRAPPTFVAVR